MGKRERERETERDRERERERERERQRERVREREERDSLFLICFSHHGVKPSKFLINTVELANYVLPHLIPDWC